MGVVIKKRTGLMPTEADLITPVVNSYYRDYPLRDVEVLNDEADPKNYQTEYVFDQSYLPKSSKDYTVKQWYVNGEKTPRYSTQTGNRNGVDVEILQGRREGSPNLIFNDTLYNGVDKSDPRWKELQLQFEGRPYKGSTGYLQLQKQGGKLTEVWVPFN